MNKSIAIFAIWAGSLLLLLSTTSNAPAQTYGTDYISFQGVLTILDNPTSAGCQSNDINYGNLYRVTYRFTANPSVIADALVLYPSGDSASRMVSTQSPNYSLNGSSTTSWMYINSHGNYGTLTPSTSNLTIMSGLNAPVTLGTGNIKMLGSINNFLAFSNCNIASIHAALVVRPN